MAHFEASSIVPAPAGDVYAWHARPGAFERLRPPWSHVEVVERQGTIESGHVRLRFRIGPFSFDWLAEHYAGVPGTEFRDRLIHGPLPRWEHVHRFLPLDAASCRMQDEITYEFPRFAAGLPAVVRKYFAERQLLPLFAYRHRIVRHDLAVHRKLSQQPLHFVVTGASGLVGSALCPFLTTGGHTVTRLVRRPSAGEDELFWDPASDRLDDLPRAPLDVVVHLAGANIAAGRWTPARKAEITASRVEATRNLSTALARLDRKPRVLVCASAIGFYGDRGSEALDEDAPAGRGFLAEVCQAWEKATAPAAAAGIRVVNLRIGVVLTPGGGALAQMLPLFRLGLGGRIGGGQQYVSWIALDDLLAVILHCGATETLRGPVNAVAPAAVTNAELVRVLARILGRPALLPAPAIGLRLFLGEMAEELLLSSTRVWPRRLLETGFQFQYGELKSALRHLLGATYVPLEQAQRTGV